MPETVGNISFDTPEGFLQEETMCSWREPPAPQLQEPRVVQRQLNVRPNLVVHRRRAQPGAELSEVAGQVYGQLSTSVTGIRNMHLDTLTFTDQVPGVLLTYEYPATKDHMLRQYHAIRLDGEMVTTFTLTTVAAELSAHHQERYLACLRSARMQGD